MSNLIFLAIALGVFLVGAIIVLAVNRARTGSSSPIDEFRNEMGAIAPPITDDPLRRRN